MKKKLIFLFLLISALNLSAQSIDADMKKLFTVSGTEAAFKNIIPLIVNSYKTNGVFSSISDEIWEEFIKEANDSYSDLEIKLAEIYKNHFTQDEIKQLIVFYETPTGKKFAGELPIIQNEAYQIGSEWGKKLGEKIAAKILKKKD